MVETKKNKVESYNNNFIVIIIISFIKLYFNIVQVIFTLHNLYVLTNTPENI